MVRSQSARVISTTISSAPEIPALLIRKSTCPSSETAWSCSRSRASGSPTSMSPNIFTRLSGRGYPILRSSSIISSRASASLPSLRALKRTRAPAMAKKRPSCRPIPRLPPVMTAVRPLCSPGRTREIEEGMALFPVERLMLLGSQRLIESIFRTRLVSVAAQSAANVSASLSSVS